MSRFLKIDWGHGPLPTAGGRVDALLWIKRPGESDGECGGEVSYFSSPRQTRELIVSSPDVAPAARRAAQSAAARLATNVPDRVSSHFGPDMAAAGTVTERSRVRVRRQRRGSGRALMRMRDRPGVTCVSFEELHA